MPKVTVKKGNRWFTIPYYENRKTELVDTFCIGAGPVAYCRFRGAMRLAVLRVLGLSFSW